MAQKKTLLKTISDMLITAPASGMVTTLYFRQGEVVPPFGNIMEVIDTRSLDIDVYISEAMLSKVKAGQKAVVSTESGQKFEGVVIRINNKAEFTPKTIQTKDERANLVYAIKIAVKNDGLLKIGMYGEVKF